MNRYQQEIVLLSFIFRVPAFCRRRSPDLYLVQLSSAPSILPTRASFLHPLSNYTSTKPMSLIPPYCHFLVSSQIASLHSWFPSGSKPSLPQPQSPNSFPFTFFRSMTQLKPRRSVQKATLVSSSCLESFQNPPLLSGQQCAKSLQLCPTLCDHMNCTPPGSSVPGILQARILEWVAMPYSRDLPHPRTKPTSLMSPALARGFFITNATWEALGQRQNCSVWPPGCVLWPFPLWLHFVPHPPHTLLSLPPSCPLSLCLISTLPLPYVLVSFSPAYTTLFSSAPGLLHMLLSPPGTQLSTQSMSQPSPCSSFVFP